jgi:hypothetical protein
LYLFTGEIIGTPMLLCVSPKYNPEGGQGGFIFSLTAVSIFGAAGGNRSSPESVAKNVLKIYNILILNVKYGNTRASNTHFGGETYAASY